VTRLPAFLCVVVLACLGLGAAPASARAGEPWAGRLRLDPVVVDVARLVDSVVHGGSGATGPGLLAPGGLPFLDGVAVRAPAATLPPDYAWVERDTRAFWFSAGTGAAATLATHVFVGLPALAFGGSLLNAFARTAPVATLALGLGGLTTYFMVESLLSAFVAQLVFDGTSETYQGRYVPALLAHFAGNVVATAVTTLTFGGGVLLLHGMGTLAGFTAAGGTTALALFSVLGAMPAVVIAAVATVAVPALVTSWALAVTALPRPGFAIDEDWQSPTARAAPPEEPRRVAAVTPLWTAALPAP
jgi:hypothetical protein